LLNRWDEKLTVQRRELEAQQKVKRQQGQKARVSPTMQKRMDEYLDLEANRREREELFKKAFRDGYWDDYKETARKGAKLWDAPKRMRVPSASPLVPNPTATNLNGEVTDVLSLVKNKKASLVTFMFSAFGEAHVNAYVQPFLKEFQNVPEVQLIQLNIEENPYKAPVLRMLSKFIKWKVPTENRGNYLMYYKSIADSRRAAGMTNNVLGWVNLVDQQGKIRWQAHGVPKEHELESMSKLLRQL
ncbi:ATPase assembly factor ATP10, partial [Gaertneriomyces semiglobifer]